MILETFATGPLETNTYLFGDEKTGEVIVIDPGGGEEAILQFLEKETLHLVGIVNTHGHFDHISGNAALKKGTGAPVMVHAGDVGMFTEAVRAAEVFFVMANNSPPPDRILEDGDEVKAGENVLTVAHTPGHSPGGISLIGEGVAFCGDLVFLGSVGRTDLAGGSQKTLLESIRLRIKTLPDSTILYPGHGPSTTVGQERSTNPYFNL